MKRHTLFIIGIALATGVVGCSTFESRVREKSETFESLNLEDRSRLAKGQVTLADTEDMVYIALGEPDEKRERMSTRGEEQIWIYRCYWQEYEGTAWTGWRRTIVPSANGRTFAVYHEPVPFNVYRTRSDEVIRVTFAAGEVVAVDQRQER